MSEQLQTTARDAKPIAPQPKPLLIADASVIRAAIADVIDAGDPDLKVTDWALWHPFETVATDARMRFIDAVERRIRELQSPMFNLGVKLQNLCNRHAKALLPEPTVSLCADCVAEFRARL